MKNYVLAGMALAMGVAMAEEPQLREVPFRFNPNFKREVTPRHCYAQEMVGKLFMSQAEFDRPFKRRDNGKSTVYLTCEQIVEVLKGMDAITLGMPKTMYLVGWQYNGHDSQYPSFFAGNPRLKRACDQDPLDSVRWVMTEGRTKYHTAVSLHVNMLDAYPDSDLFEEYLKHDIIAKEKDGQPIKSEWGYKISYPQEWEKGFAQKRLDRLLKLLPIQETGTLHIDAFHCQAPIGYLDAQGRPRIRMQSPISPYLKFTRQDDIDAQKKIIKFLDERGVDVTEEGCVQEAGDQLLGNYVPMLFHYNSGLGFRYPISVVGGANYNGPWNRVLGRSFNTEQHFRKYGVNAESFARFRGAFCRNTLILNFFAHHTPQKAYEGKNIKRVVYDRGVVAEEKGGAFTVVENGITLVDGDDAFIPAEWTAEKDIIAYSAKGYASRTWQVPAGFPKSGTVKVSEIDEKGAHSLSPIAFADGKVTLAVKPNQMLRLEF